MDRMDLRVADNPDAERYEVFADGELAGFVTYGLQDGRIVLRHTEVDDAFEGQGVGSGLVSRVLEDVRARGLEVLPLCSFVRGYIARHPDYLDLVPEDQRAKFGLN
jgi:predicted GNAT family acetyltransferase